MVALPVLPSQDGHDATSSATTPARMSSNLIDDAEDRTKIIESIQISSNYDASPAHTDATSIRSLYQGDSQYDSKDPATAPVSQIHGPDQANNKFRRNNSPSISPEFSLEERMKVLPDLTPNCSSERSEFKTDNQDNLGPFYDEIPKEGSMLENLNPLESGFGAQDLSLTVSNGLEYLGHDLKGGNDLESISKRPEQAGPLLNNQHYSSPVLNRPHSSEFISMIPRPESNIVSMGDLTESSLQGLDHPESDPDQKNNEGLSWDGQKPMNPSSPEARRDSALGGPGHQASISAKADHIETIMARESDPESISTEHGQLEITSEIQSRSEFLDGPKSFTGEGQHRHFHREAKLHNLLSRALQTRARAYEKRSQLRQSRTELSVADESFMKLVRESRFHNGQDDSVLEASFKRLQDARDKYGPLEEAYNAIEEQLNNEEYEAKELEEKILKSASPAPEFEFNSRSSGLHENDSEFSEIVRELRHPLYEAYLSRLGDADLCREALTEQLIEHNNLLHSQEVKRRIGIELSSDDLATLENFPAAEEKLKNKLRSIEEDVEHLRLECVQEGLFADGENEFEDEHPIEDDGEEIDLEQTLTTSEDLEQTEFNKYPILLEKPEEKEDEERSKVLLTDFKEGDIGDRITCWLLHKLRLSGLEVELLARVNSGIDQAADNIKWQEEVLEFWFFDSTNLPPSAYQLEQTHSAFPPSPPPSPHLLPSMDLHKESRNGFSDSYHIQLVIRSSALSRKLEFPLRLKLSRIRRGSALTV